MDGFWMVIPQDIETYPLEICYIANWKFNIFNR